jgi:hypothetical protein
MTSDRAEQQALELLVALGRVAPPSAAVLAAARESLWLPVDAERLAADLTEDAMRTRPSETPPAHRRRPAQPPRRRHRGAAD